MPKLKDQISAENTIATFKCALIRLGASEKRLGAYVAMKLGCSEKTGLRYVKEPNRLTVSDMRHLRLTNDEIIKIVRGD